MTGRYCRVEPLDLERHARDLHLAYGEDRDGRLWSYLPYGPFPRLEDYLAHATAAWLGDARVVYAVIDLKTGKAVG